MKCLIAAVVCIQVTCFLIRTCMQDTGILESRSGGRADRRKYRRSKEKKRRRSRNRMAGQCIFACRGTEQLGTRYGTIASRTYYVHTEEQCNPPSERAVLLPVPLRGIHMGIHVRHWRRLAKKDDLLVNDSVRYDFHGPNGPLHQPNSRWASWLGEKL